jgi:hypothetical protein
MTGYEPGPLDKHFKALLHMVVDAKEIVQVAAVQTVYDPDRSSWF